MAFKAVCDHEGKMLDISMEYITTKGLIWGLDAEKIALILDAVSKTPWLDEIIT